MDQPLVTVLMPVYNCEKHLKDAIDSILNQTYSNFHFLIINDGSTDQSESIIFSYQDERIRYIKNEENIQLIDSLNKGLDLISTKYIARMDADDIAHPHRLQKQVEYLEMNSNCVVCGSFYQFIGESEEMIQLPVFSDQIKFQLLHFNSFCHPSTVLRTSVLKNNKIQYHKDFKHAEDYFLWTELALKGDFYNLPEVLLFYRKHDSQISQLHQKHQKDIELSIQTNYLNKLTEFHNESSTTIALLHYLQDEKKEIHSMKLLEVINHFFVKNKSLKVFSNQFLKNRLRSTIHNLILSSESMSLREYIKIKRSIFYTRDLLTAKQKLNLLKLILFK